MQTIESLEKILKENSEDFIIDNNVFSIDREDRYLITNLNNASKINQLDKNSLKYFLRYIRKFNDDIIDIPNACFIKEVGMELSDLKESLDKKYIWLRHKIYRRVSQKIGKLDLLNKISHAFSESIYKMESKETKIDDERYKYIFDCVDIVSKHFSKKNYEEKKKNSYLKTDEKIIALSFHKILTENKNCSIVSNDLCMANIFHTAYRLLTCDKIYYNLGKMRDNNINFYSIFRNNPNYNLFMKSEEIKSLEKIDDIGVRPWRIKEINHKFADALSKYYK